MGERLPCTEEVRGSSPLISTKRLSESSTEVEAVEGRLSDAISLPSDGNPIVSCPVCLSESFAAWDMPQAVVCLTDRSGWRLAPAA